MASSRDSQPRQNFHVECEAGINKQINMELYASYVYQSMAYYFDRDDVALKGFHKFFKESSDEERGHAELLMNYQNMRGGRVALNDIKKPDRDEWGAGVDAMTTALALEKRVNQALLDLHQIGDSHGDPQFMDFIEGTFLKEQVESIKSISDLCSRLRRAGPGVGEHLIDQELKG